VTPPEAVENSTLDSTGGKQVRFGQENEEDSGSSTDNRTSQRGLVSRRGRYVSPGRRSGPPITNNNSSCDNSLVMEYKTFRSPPRKRQDEVPSLCSTNSGQLTTVTASAESTTTHHEAHSSSIADRQKQAPASSISVNPGMEAVTSPLASHDAVENKLTMCLSPRTEDTVRSI
jgi:hypothetical protein